MKIEEAVQGINDIVSKSLPRHFVNGQNSLMWNCQILGACEQVYSTEDKVVRIHDTQGNFVVEDDRFDLQICHLIEKASIENYAQLQNVSLPTYRFDAVIIGCSKYANVGRYLADYVSKIDYVDLKSYSDDAMKLFPMYWRTNMKKVGQNPDKYVFAIYYNFRATNNDRKYFFEQWLTPEQIDNSINYEEIRFKTNI